MPKRASEKREREREREKEKERKKRRTALLEKKEKVMEIAVFFGKPLKEKPEIDTFVYILKGKLKA
jgi:hypothetical protein